MEGELKEESLNKFGKRGKGAISGLENRERKSEPGMRSRKQKSPTLTLFDQQVSVPWRNKMKHAAHKPEEGLCRRRKWGAALCTPGQDEGSPCEVQGNGGGNTSIWIFPESLTREHTLISCILEPGITDEKSCAKLAPFLETCVCYLFARGDQKPLQVFLGTHTESCWGGRPWAAFDLPAKLDKQPDLTRSMKQQKELP